MNRTPISAIAQFAPLTIYVRGKVAFSRIASKIDGAELAKQNQEAASKGRMPHSKPYVTITIKDPVILGAGLPVQVTNVIQERFYVSKTDGATYFSQESKSPFLPTVVYSKEAGELAGQGIADDNVPLQAELAKDLDVTIGVSLFSKNGFAGLGINYIFINEPIKYYTASSMATDFAAQGITYVPPTQQNTQPNVAQTQVTAQMPVQEQYSPMSQITAPQVAVDPNMSFNPPYTNSNNQPMQQPFNKPMPGMQEQQVQRPVRYY